MNQPNLAVILAATVFVTASLVVVLLIPWMTVGESGSIECTMSPVALPRSVSTCCRTAVGGVKASLPTYVLLAGLLDSGQDTIVSILAPQPHVAVVDRNDAAGDSLDRAQWIKQIFDRLGGGLSQVALDADRTLHTDLDYLLAADGHAINLHVLALLRDPSDVLASVLALHPTNMSLLRHHARLIEHEAVYMDAVVRHVPCDRLAFVRLDHISENSADYRLLIELLARWTHSKASTLFDQAARSFILPPRLSSPVEATSFFTSKQPLWPMLTRCSGFCEQPSDFCPLELAK